MTEEKGIIGSTKKSKQLTKPTVISQKKAPSLYRVWGFQL